MSFSNSAGGKACRIGDFKVLRTLGNLIINELIITYCWIFMKKTCNFVKKIGKLVQGAKPVSENCTFFFSEKLENIGTFLSSIHWDSSILLSKAVSCSTMTKQCKRYKWQLFHLCVIGHLNKHLVHAFNITPNNPWFGWLHLKSFHIEIKESMIQSTCRITDFFHARSYSNLIMFWKVLFWFISFLFLFQNLKPQCIGQVLHLQHLHEQCFSNVRP